MFCANNLKVMNNFFKRRNYTRWRSFNKSRTPDMLDVITFSTSFFECVNDCGTTPDVLRSNHYAARMLLLNHSIKFKSDYTKRPVIDWKKLKIPELNGKFNLILKMKLRGKHDYTEYNKSILSSAEETAMTVGSKCQGWYQHSRDTLTPSLDTRNEVLYDIRANKMPPSGQTIAKIRNLQW